MRRFLFAIILVVVSITLTAAQGNSAGTAAAIAPNGSAGGSISDLSTDHYWKVTTAADGYLRVQIASSSGLDVDARLYDTDGTTSIMFDGQSGLNSEVFGFLKPGTYYLRVYRWAGTSGTYSVSTSFSSTVKTGDAEPNDTAPAAISLSPSGSSTGHIGYFSAGQTDYDDYWKITTTEDGWLRVQVRSDSLDVRGDQRFDLDVHLYDVDGTTLISYDYRTGTFSQVAGFVRPGTYYVRVYRWYGRAGEYDITSDFFTPPQANDAEGNDSAPAALAVPLNGSATGHLGYFGNGTTDSDDYWKFTTTVDGTVTITVVSDSIDRSGARYDLDMVVYDVDGTSSIVSDIRNGPFSERVLYLRPGTYYARLYRYTGNGASYNIAVAQSIPSRPNDPEGNDWYNTATPLTLNIPGTGHAGYYSNGTTDAHDVWRIVAPSSDSIYIHVTSDAAIDLDVVAYGPDTTTSITSDGRYGTYSRVGIKPTAGLSYYFYVYLYSGTAGSYSISALPTSIAVGIEDSPEKPLVPGSFALSQNYPNPFNPSTTIHYALPRMEHVTLTVFNTLGQYVATLVNTEMNAGVHEVRFDGSGFASGLYLYRMQAGDFVETKKFLLMK